MLTFIHTYTEESFPGLAANGLWHDDDGLKLMHKPGFKPPFDFNTVAAVGSPLDRLLRELNCPFYIDRLQGGLGLTRLYPYDHDLLRHYEKALGDRFWGFQMHEWASNFRSDLERIEELARKEAVDSKDVTQREGFWQKVISGNQNLFLEAHAAVEYAKTPLTEDLSDFFRDMRSLYAKRTKETCGLLFPTDSYFMAPRIEIENGAKRLMPEMGWQIPGMRLQIAYTRGMAKAAGIPWGMYYECWQETDRKALSIPYSLREGEDEWREDLLHKCYGSDFPFSRREHGGSSLSLMTRAWRYAAFSGAGVIGEEYGVCNTFRNLKDFELSPYGEVKKEFLCFIQDFPDLGTPFAPIAAVLPADLPILDLYMDDRYLHFPVDDPACPAVMHQPALFREKVNSIFGSNGQHGNMGHVLRTGGLPGVVDVIHADMTDALRQYDLLIDLTGDTDFKAKHDNIVSVEEADRLLDALLPCRFDERLFVSYNRTSGGWLALVMNNDGVTHDGFQPDEFSPEAAVHSEIRPTSRLYYFKKLAGNGTLQTDAAKADVLLKAGDWLLLSITERLSEK